MRVTIEQVKNVGLGDLAVTFVCDIGKAAAQWTGSTPIIGKTYDVELEIPSPKKWGSDIFESNESYCAFSLDSNESYLVAKLISVDESNIGQIQINDSVVFLEIDNIDLQLPSFVKIRISDLQLFNINL